MASGRRPKLRIFQQRRMAFILEIMEVFFLPPYAPEYNPDEYLNHALKISVHSGQLPYTTEDISHKIQSFMRIVQDHPSAVSSFYLPPSLSYLCPQK